MLHKPPLLKFCTAGILSLCIIGSAYGQTSDLPDPPVCDRTEEVRDTIVNRVGASDCSEVTNSQLATITSFTLASIKTTELQSGDFAGLINSDLLVIVLNTQLQTLPADIFAGISPLYIDLRDNLFGQGLPSALIDYFKTFSNNLFVDLVAVQDVLQATTLALAVGVPMDVDLEDAFFYAGGTNVRNPADSYQITVADTSAATAAASGHTLTLTPVGEGQTTINIVGVQSSNGQKAIQTLTVQVITYPEPDPPVCERTVEVRDAIVASAAVSDCNAVTGNLLAAINNLAMSGISSTELRSDDFAGLINSDLILIMSNTQLQTLPADIFAGISPAIIDISNNSFGKGLPSALIDYFKMFSNTLFVDLVFVQDTLPASLELTAVNTVELDLEDAFFYADGTNVRGPADSYTITAADDTVLEATAGTGASNQTLTITPLANGESTVTIAGSRDGHTATQTLTVIVEVPSPEPPVCKRAPQVRDAIVEAIDGVGACEVPSIYQLAMISSLDLSGSGATALQSSDFNGLAGLAELDLSNNHLQTLPADIFDPISETITSINLQGNPFGGGLPLALIDYFKTFSNTLHVNLAAVRDVLPTTTLALAIGAPMNVDLEDAFFYAVGTDTRNPADSYEITVADALIATATATAGDHTLTITAVSAGQTEIDIAGVRSNSEQRATQTLTVGSEAQLQTYLRFRIKVFLEGAQ